MRALALDPGGTSGLASWVGGAHEAWMLPYGEVADYLEDAVPDFDLLVVEDYVITVQTAKKSRRDANDTIELIGIARHLARRAEVDFATQTVSEAFSFGTDSKLQRLGWHRRGPDHMNSASRHLLLALVKRGAIDPRRFV